MNNRQENERRARDLEIHGGQLSVVSDRAIDDLIRLLSRPTQDLTPEDYLDSIARRQDAVNKFLIRGGIETLRRFFNRIMNLERDRAIKLDLSMLELSGRLLSDLYLPGANLEKLAFTESDISGSNLVAAKLNEVVAPNSIMRGVIATGSDWTNAVIPGADMSGARFIGARFVNTIMNGVIVDQETNFLGARFIGTYLSGVDLSHANITGAVFRGIHR